MPFGRKPTSTKRQRREALARVKSGATWRDIACSYDVTEAMTLRLTANMESCRMGDDKEHGRFALVMVPIIVAAITGAGMLGAAVLSNWDKLFPQKLPIPAPSESNAAAAPSMVSGARPLLPPVPVAMLKTNGPLFIVAPTETEGAAIGARIVNELQEQGFRVVNSRDDAKLLIEIQAPDLAPAQVSPIGSLEGFSVVTTLTAKLQLRNDGKKNAAPVQRQALGVGATEVDARRNSIAAASDRLGESIVETLR